MSDETKFTETNVEELTRQLQEARQQLREARETAARTASCGQIPGRSNDEIHIAAADQMKSEFVANMSREIRTPMTAILGFADLLLDPRETNLPQATRNEMIRTIQRNGRHLLTIINDIIDLSKIDADRVTLEMIPFSPQQIVEEVASLMRVRASEKRVDWSVEYETRIPAVIPINPTRLQQILMTLCGNSIKFTTYGSVRLVCRFIPGDSARMEFDVIDTGVGMTAQQCSGLFRPLAQATASTTRNCGATGLGLTLSRRFARLMGGEVELVDTKPGKGSHFRCSIAVNDSKNIQLVSPDDESYAEAPLIHFDGLNTDSSIDLTNCRILLAEDGPDNQRLIAHFLRRNGAEVTIVENGKLAVDRSITAQSDNLPFDVILMDMQMPVLDGYSATALLRAKGYRRPIVALTAHAMASDEQKCLLAGCDGYATKPIERRVLLRTIEKFWARASTRELAVATA